MTNEVLETLKKRRSIRSYSEKPVEEEKLAAILEAGTYAATGMNRQSPVIVAVENKEDREILRNLNAEIIGNPDSDPFYGASVVVVVLADKNIRTHTEDGSLVIGNMMLAAASLGVSSCWIHRAKETFERPEGKALLKKWGLSENLEGVGNCIFGYSAVPVPEARARKADYIKIVK